MRNLLHNKIMRVMAYIVMWMYKVDRSICSGQNRTNPFFATLSIYLSGLLGMSIKSIMARYPGSEVISTQFADIPVQVVGLFLLLSMMNIVESITSCHYLISSIIRIFIIFFASAVFMYLGMSLPTTSIWLLFIIAFVYAIFLLIYILARINLAKNLKWHRKSL